MFRVLSLALVACLLMAGSAFADMKIGVFNSQAVAMDSDAAKAAQQKLQSQFGAEKTQLEKQSKDLQSKGEALQAQVAKMSAKEREDKQMEFLRLRRREKLLRRGGAVRLLLRLRRGAQAVSVDELLELQLQEQVV